MYQTLRMIHLTVGLLATPAMLIYGITVVQLALRIENEPKVETRELQVRADPTDVSACIRELDDVHGIAGAVRSANAGDEHTHIDYARGAYRIEVAIEPDGHATVTSRHAGLSGFMMGLHVAAGVQQQHWATRVWTLLAFVSALALSGLLVTGFWMWLKRPRERRFGLAFLAFNLLWGGGTLIWIRLIG